MDKIVDILSAITGAFVGYFLGGLDGLCYALLAFIIIDYISGVLVAISRKELSSEVGFKGISKKVLIIALVGIANIVDHQVLGGGSTLRTATIFFYLANEGLSILENATNLGLKLPSKLTAVLKQIGEKTNESSDDTVESTDDKEENNKQ